MQYAIFQMLPTGQHLFIIASEGKDGFTGASSPLEPDCIRLSPYTVRFFFCPGRGSSEKIALKVTAAGIEPLPLGGCIPCGMFSAAIGAISILLPSFSSL
jgi:hypothetical protein